MCLLLRVWGQGTDLRPVIPGMAEGKKRQWDQPHKKWVKRLRGECLMVVAEKAESAGCGKKGVRWLVAISGEGEKRIFLFLTLRLPDSRIHTSSQHLELLSPSSQALRMDLGWSQIHSFVANINTNYIFLIHPHASNPKALFPFGFSSLLSSFLTQWTMMPSVFCHPRQI